MSTCQNVQAIFFDLDYTLYDQRQYLRGAFEDVAYTIANACCLDPASLYRSLLTTWERVGTDYGYLFNEWVAQLGISVQSHIKRCIEAFHAHQPKGLMLYPGVEQMLQDLKSDYLVGLITDGDAGMQQSKVAALDVEERFDLIVYAGHLALRKPDPRIFEHALHEARLSTAEALHVGDHPVKDIVGARRTGLHAIRVMTGEFSVLPDDPLYPPTYHLARVSEIPKALHAIL